MATATRRVHLGLERLLEKIEKYIVPEKQIEFAHIAELARLDSCITLIEGLFKEARIRSNAGLDEIATELHELRAEYQTLKRRLELSNPSTQEAFIRTLWWMAEKGMAEDLEMLRQMKEARLYWSEDIQRLFEIIEQRFRERIGAPSKNLQDFFHLSQEEYVNLIGAVDGESQTLASQHTLQVIQNLREIKESLEALIKPDRIGDWLNRSNPEFGGKTPRDTIAAGETDRVLEVLARLEGGVHN